MFELHLKAESPEALKLQLVGMLNLMNGVGETAAPVKPETKTEEIKPVLTPEQMEENVKNAPVHELPPVPPIEEVRDALKQLRARKGTDAVKALLKEYNADSVPDLKEEDYLIVRDRALMEV